MNTASRTTLWQQFEASIDTLENAMNDRHARERHERLPEGRVGNASRTPESTQDFWHTAFHTLF
jgi:hypothetical protein